MSYMYLCAVNASRLAPAAMIWCSYSHDLVRLLPGSGVPVAMTVAMSLIWCSCSHDLVQL